MADAPEKFIVYTGDGDALYDIHVIDLNQGTEENENGPAQLTTGDTLDIHPDWSPDGSRIVYLSHQLGSSHGHISVVDADGQAHVRLTKDVYYHPPKWRP